MGPIMPLGPLLHGPPDPFNVLALPLTFLKSDPPQAPRNTLWSPCKPLRNTTAAPAFFRHNFSSWRTGFHPLPL
ncbi:Hypothetical protein SRAE_0000065300 [Strongyloides ratti]|uniref:Uncharacterized protein n=1 Tax=Strongyloides ratti TaxID=34506 RepID=A0A090KVT3_STRRB|nr:Hypothetical protein SRAE_0000065300 [Strongyloides ratti]CEF61531.1 Hypothetical protein SRAE_0000065300 [Strongyloides ratti]